MSCELHLRNRQRSRKLDLQLFRKILLTALDELRVEQFELGISIISEDEMTRLNETFLKHKGSTDVITFDYSSHVTRHPSLLLGELFICIDEAVLQSKRFRTTWQSELVRYAIHGILHLLGHDDKRTTARVKMKREENKLLGNVASQFDLKKISPGPRKQS